MTKQLEISIKRKDKRGQVFTWLQVNFIFNSSHVPSIAYRISRRLVPCDGWQTQSPIDSPV